MCVDLFGYAIYRMFYLGLVWTEYDMEKKGHHSRMRYIEDTALGGGITQEFPSYTSKTTRGLLYVKLLQYISQ